MCIRDRQRPADVEFHFGGSELFDNVAGVGKGAGQVVELGDHEGVAAAAGGEGFAQSGSVPVPSGQAVIDVDPVGLRLWDASLLDQFTSSLSPSRLSWSMSLRPRDV